MTHSGMVLVVLVAPAVYTFNFPPWFCKNLSTPTTDHTELRLCQDQMIANEENVLFEMVELSIC